MTTSLPDYCPPNTQRASLAAGVAPLLVLAGFTAVVARLVEADFAFALFAACTVWVVYEMHVYQATVDRYNADYVASHLEWRSTATLRQLGAVDGTAEATRRFVGRFLDAERVLLADGQLP